jgi:pimeloyl-ACP methyl ester carboxylesterase
MRIVVAKAKANGIEIEYETFGDRSGSPLLLIIGIGLQMIYWSKEFCDQLVDGGHYVIRFDNRDTGLSTKFEEDGVPDIAEAINTLIRGKKYVPPYNLYDMGNDAVGLLDALGIEKAHICGMSMGAAIAQTIAITHPSRVLSLISIYGSTGNPNLPRPKPEIMALITTPPPIERNAFIESRIYISNKISGSGFPIDEVWTREIVAQAYDRAFYPQGVARHYVAHLEKGNRRPALASVTAPTLVIHGDEDPLMLLEGGKDTVEAIPGAELMIIKGMGHKLPHGDPWPQIGEAITAHTRKVFV